jgi:7-keto-8-aminopelargonate synthetase-like enzyme
MEALGFQKIDSEAPIVSVNFRDARRNRAFADQLWAAEIYPPFITYPGGPAGGHFRFTFSSVHTDEEVERLMQVIERAV